MRIMKETAYKWLVLPQKLRYNKRHQLQLPREALHDIIPGTRPNTGGVVYEEDSRNRSGARPHGDRFSGDG